MVKFTLVYMEAYNSVQLYEPFRDQTHISLEQSVSADLSRNTFRKCIASICFGPNHSAIFLMEIWIFEKVIFNVTLKIWFFGLTWRVKLLSRYNLKTLRSQITCF